MCGLVGIFGNITPNLQKAFQALLILDIKRGPHSTGVAIVSGQRTPYIIKNTQLPSRILRSKKFKRELKTNPILLMGHNRFATKGEVTKENAHPFKVGNITLAHNGTVFDVPTERKRGIDSDTLLLTTLISENGLEEWWKDFWGAATFTFWDNEKRTFNIVSDQKRPFFYCITENEDALIWASELEMLKIVVKKYKIKIEQKKEGDCWWFPSKDTLLSWSWDGKGFDYKMTTLKKTLCSGYNNFGWSGQANHYNQSKSILDWREGRGDDQGDSNIPFGLDHGDGNEYKALKLLSNMIDENEFWGLPEWLHCTFCKRNISLEFEWNFFIDDGISCCNNCEAVAKSEDIPIDKDALI